MKKTSFSLARPNQTVTPCGEVVKKTITTKLNVVIPEIKLRLDDLDYLKQLAEHQHGDQASRCKAPRGSTIYRLRLLGLITEKNMGPDPKAQREWQKSKITAKKRALKALYQKPEPDWVTLNSIGFYSLSREEGRFADRKMMVVTKAGLKLLMAGAATSEVVRSC